MSRVGRAAARAVIGLYPRTWRHRYEGELRALVDDTDPGMADALDVAAGAIREHATGGASLRFVPAHRHPVGFAWAAMLIMAPTLVFVTLSVIGHELGVSGVASVADPVIKAVTASRIVDLGMVVAPLVALVLATLPLLAARFESGEGGRLLSLQVRVLRVNLAVAVVAALLGAALVAHMVAEAVLNLRGGG